MPIVLTNREWIETWRANGEGHVFPGAPAGWTADQRRLVSVTREYAAAFSTLGTTGHDPPGSDVLGDYHKFHEWWGRYSKDPKSGGERYTHGFRN